MTPVERQRAAKALNGNPLLTECFDKAIANCFTAWQASTASDERETLWNRVKAIQLVRNEVYAAVKSALRDEQRINAST
jgi:hypothetical protein